MVVIFPLSPLSDLCGCALRRTKQRKQDDIANGVGVGQQHADSIDADANAPGWRHAVGKRADVILIHLVSFIIAALAFLQLRLKSPPLVLGIVEFAEAVGKFHLPGKNFETLRPLRLIRLLLGERRDRGREFVNDGGLSQMFFGDRFKQTGNRLSHGLFRVVCHVRMPGIETVDQFLHALRTGKVGDRGFAPAASGQ